MLKWKWYKDQGQRISRISTDNYRAATRSGVMLILTPKTHSLVSLIFTRIFFWLRRVRRNIRRSAPNWLEQAHPPLSVWPILVFWMSISWRQRIYWYMEILRCMDRFLITKILDLATCRITCVVYRKISQTLSSLSKVS